MASTPAQLASLREPDRGRSRRKPGWLPRSRPIVLLVTLSLLAGLGIYVPTAVATGSDPIRYTYDTSGRLTGAVDPAVGSAKYSYDAAGNTTAITRTTVSTLGVLGFTPSAGSTGTTVTISGSGFSTTAENNTVKFNGTTASVTSATTTALVATVPSGASSGTVSVTVGGTTATSTETFRIGGGPAINALSSSVVSPGASLTITGTGFETSASRDVVGLNTSRSVVSSATATSLSVVVPSSAASGKATVWTPLGSATSSADLYVAPPGFTASDVQYTGRATIGGSTVTATISTATRIGLLLFDGAAGQRVSFKFTSVTFSDLDTTIYSPDGTELHGDSDAATNTFYDTMTLPFTGTYEMLLDPSSTYTGAATVQIYDVPADATTSATMGGSAVTQSTSTPGQNGTVTFSGTAGQRASWKFTSVTYSDLNVAILKPDGSVLRAEDDAQTNTFYDPITLPTTGTYTVAADPTGASTGAYTVQVYDVPADPSASATIGGSAVTQSTSVPGQNGTITFSGTAGQRASWKFTNVTYSDLDATIYKPDGSVLRSTADAATNTFYDTLTLPTTGTYTLAADPSKYYTGAYTIQIFDVPSDATASATIGGSAVTQSTSVPGQNGTITFSGTAGQRASWKFTNVTYSDLDVAILKPDGSVLKSEADAATNTFYDTITLPTTGTYTLAANPTSSYTGAYTVQIYDVPADATGTATIGGSAVTQSTSTPGQNGTITFSGTAGQRASWKFTNVTYSDLDVTILKPDGSVLRSTADAATNTFYDTLTLPTTGTYTLAADPTKYYTGAYTVQIYDVPYVTSSITIGGSNVTVTTNYPGQDAKVTFSGTSGQGISLVLSSVSISQSDVSIQRPDGTDLVAPTLVTTTGKTITATLNATGTFTILINPRSTYTGSMTLALTQTAALEGPTFADIPRAIAGVGHAGRPTAARPATRQDAKAVVTPEPPGPRVAQDDDDDDTWIPDASNRHGNWRSGRARTVWQDQPRLQAPDGVTAVSGVVLDLRGRPLRGVTLTVGGVSATSDLTGRFLITGPPIGTQTFEIDGSTVVGRPGRTYGFFETSVEVYPGMTYVLPYIVWLGPIDKVHTVSITNPTTGEVTLTTPYIPGLEVHIPAGSTVEGEDEVEVDELGITPIPIDRPPFPLPENLVIPVYFTVQPGGAYVEPDGAWIVYPNYNGLAPGSRTDFWQYDPDDPRGWFVYGQGTVTANGQQVVPDPGVRVYAFDGAMMNGSGLVPALIALLNDLLDGDPVDLATGLFANEKTDLVVSDVMPLSVTRTYRQSDTASRPFGRGTNWNYGIFLWSANQYQEADLILPGSQRIHYVRTSPGTGFGTAEFESTTTPGPYFKSTIVWNGNGWDLRLRDGTTYVFRDNAPLSEIRDRNGNRIVITRENGDTNGNIVKVSASNGHWIDFTYDTSNRVTSATDNIGRQVTYTYDAAGYLWKVTDVAGGVTEYLYDGSGRMTSIKDARGITYLTNTYDSNSRVSHQVQADGSTYDFAYTLSGSTVTQTDVTDQRGFVRRVTFDAAGHPLTDTAAYGQAIAQTTTLTRQSGTELVTSVTDALGRRTDFAYDSLGNTTSITRLAGTGSAVTTSMTYESTFSQLATVTDPLSHTTTFAHDAKGNVSSVTDARGKTTTFTYDSQGKVLSTTDSTSKTSTFSYVLGDLSSVTAPGSITARQLVDGVGRIIGVTDPSGGISTVAYDTLNRPTTMTDGLGNATATTYDANGNVLTITDPRSGVTTYTYDDMDRLATRTDPLSHAESYTYDLAGNLVEQTDRKSQHTAFTYDALGRASFVGFKKVGSGGSATYESTITNTYDAGNRLLTAVDSGAGTITFTHDNLDRLTSEASPQGSMSYAYDAADRQTGATLTGETAVAYAYDAADRLTSITQGSAVTSYAYDDAGRPTSMTYPSGIVGTYSYDSATRLAGIEYKQGATTIGDLTYGYDLAGRRVSVGGSLARTGLPSAVSSATYNAANQLTAWNGASLTYDLAGNLTSDGTSSLTWNARGELIGITGPTSASFTYDALGRRIDRTIAGSSTAFAYDGASAVQERVGGSPSSNQLVGGLDATIRRVDGAGTRELLTDALGSTIGLVDGSGAITTSYTYEPYGATTTSGSASANPSQFTGREADGSGLYYYRARYYSPSLGRFISEDPAGFSAGDPNLYRYVGDDPVNATDPSGMFGPWAVGCAIGAAAELAITGIEAMSGRKDADAADYVGSAVRGCVLGLLGTGLAKLLEKLIITEGIYIVETVSGLKYVGQSGDIARRLAQHVASGKITQQAADQAIRIAVRGGKTAREIAEQLKIDELGGVDALANVRNPIGEARRALLQTWKGKEGGFGEFLRWLGYHLP